LSEGIGINLSKSLNFFGQMIFALGYEITLAKKTNKLIKVC